MQKNVNFGFGLKYVCRNFSKCEKIIQPGQHTKTVGGLLGGFSAFGWSPHSLAMAQHFSTFGFSSARLPTRPSSRRTTRRSHIWPKKQSAFGSPTRWPTYLRFCIFVSRPCIGSVEAMANRLRLVSQLAWPPSVLANVGVGHLQVIFCLIDLHLRLASQSALPPTILAGPIKVMYRRTFAKSTFAFD